MGLRLVQANVKARDDVQLGRFWAAALGWNASAAGNGATSVTPAGCVWTDPAAPVCIDVITVPGPELLGGGVHLELTHQAGAVARLIELGATPADGGPGDVPGPR